MGTVPDSDIQKTAQTASKLESVTAVDVVDEGTVSAITTYAGTKVELTPDDYHLQIALDAQECSEVDEYSTRFAVSALQDFVYSSLSPLENEFEVRGYHVTDDGERVNTFIRISTDCTPVQRLRKRCKRHEEIAAAFSGSEVAMRLTHWFDEPWDYDLIVVVDKPRKRSRPAEQDASINITTHPWTENEVRELAHSVAADVTDVSDISGIGLKDGNNLTKYPVFTIDHTVD